MITASNLFDKLDGINEFLEKKTSVKIDITRNREISAPISIKGTPPMHPPICVPNSSAEGFTGSPPNYQEHQILRLCNLF